MLFKYDGCASGGDSDAVFGAFKGGIIHKAISGEIAFVEFGMYGNCLIIGIVHDDKRAGK